MVLLSTPRWGRHPWEGLDQSNEYSLQSTQAIGSWVHLTLSDSMSHLVVALGIENQDKPGICVHYNLKLPLLNFLGSTHFQDNIQNSPFQVVEETQKWRWNWEPSADLLIFLIPQHQLPLCSSIPQWKLPSSKWLSRQYTPKMTMDSRTYLCGLGKVLHSPIFFLWAFLFPCTLQKSLSSPWTSPMQLAQTVLTYLVGLVKMPFIQIYPWIGQ